MFVAKYLAKIVYKYNYSGCCDIHAGGQSMDKKKIVFTTDNWARFFINAYQSSYKETLIGIASSMTHDIYTSQNYETSDTFDIFIKTNVFPEISYEELVARTKENNIDIVYLKLCKVEGYTLSFRVYDTSKNDVTCICDDEEEVRLVLKAFNELSKL